MKMKSHKNVKQNTQNAFNCIENDIFMLLIGETKKDAMGRRKGTHNN